MSSCVYLDVCAEHVYACVVCLGESESWTHDKDVELFGTIQDTHQPSAIVETGVTTAPPGRTCR